jgi:hypothetical protein
MKGFCQRASEILDKWAPLFLENLPSRRWAIQGNYLRYIPSDEGDFFFPLHFHG